MKSHLLVPFALVALLCTAGCASAKKDAADAAIATSTAAFGAIREEAARYSPSEAAAVEKALQSARDNRAKGDYSKALSVAKDIPSQIQELSASVTDRKDELRGDWEDLSATVPGLIRSVRSGIDRLDRAHKGSSEVRQALAAAQKQWRSANESYAADELLTAVGRANSSKVELLALEAELRREPEK